MLFKLHQNIRQISIHSIKEVNNGGLDVLFEAKKQNVFAKPFLFVVFLEQESRKVSLVQLAGTAAQENEL